jgi:hypothetical protein
VVGGARLEVVEVVGMRTEVVACSAAGVMSEGGDSRPRHPAPATGVAPSFGASWPVLSILIST